VVVIVEADGITLVSKHHLEI